MIGQKVVVQMGAGVNPSPAVATGGGRLVAISVPDDSQSLTTFSFRVSQDGATYQDAYDDAGSEIVVLAPPAPARGHVDLDDVGRGWEFFRLRTGTAAAPESLAASIAIMLLFRGEGDAATVVPLPETVEDALAYYEMGVLDYHLGITGGLVYYGHGGSA